MQYVRAGFRAVFRQPALILGEISWRWAFGLAAWTLVAFAVQRIMARVDITEAELLIARRSDLFLIADACARILYQVLPQLARECVVLVPAITVMWIAAATLGRAATLNILISNFEVAGPGALAVAAPGVPEFSTAPGRGKVRFSSLTFLHLLRALFTLATIVAFFGAMFLAGIAMPKQNPATAAAVWIFLAALVAFCWSMVNWFFALAPISIVRDGRTALESISDSVNLFRRGTATYGGISWWFGLLRALALMAAMVAALIAASGSTAAAVAGCVAVTLVYFAIADFLYIARLAAFVALNESSQISAISSQPIPPPAMSPAAQL